MLSGHFHKQDWILLLSSAEDDIYGVPYVKKGGRILLGRIRKIEQSAMPECARCHIVIKSPKVFITRNSFPKVKPAVLNMMIDDHVKEAGFFGSDMIFTHAFKVLDTSARNQQILIISTPKEMVDVAMDFAEKMKVNRLISITPSTVAVSALVSKINEEKEAPVIVVTETDAFMEFTLCYKGIPYSSQTIPLLETSNKTQIILQGIQALSLSAKRDIGITVQAVMMNDADMVEAELQKMGISVIEPDFSQFFHAENDDDLKIYPEMAGVFFVSKELNHIPDRWRVVYNVQDALFYASAAAGVAAIVMGSFAIYFNNSIEHYKSVYETKSVIVNRQIDQIRTQLPSSQEKGQLEEFIKLWKQNHDEPRMDDLLITIGGCLPNTVKIKQMKFERKDKLNLNVVFGTSGSFKIVKTRFEKTVNMLRSSFAISDVKWSYDDAVSSGTMTLNLNPGIQ